MREMERRRELNGGRKPEKTCFDFVLCLNKKRKVRRQDQTDLNNVATETKPLGEEGKEQQAAADDVKIKLTVEDTNTNKAGEEAGDAVLIVRFVELSNIK